jgi:hypothetical protein
VDFSAQPVTSFGSQDTNSTMAIEDGGASLRITGNGWKKIALPWTITANTVLEFDFSSSSQGEVHGIGFDTNESPSGNRTFKVYGTQNWGINAFDNYTGSGVTHYTIPVGQYFTGSYTYLVFLDDHDVGSPTGESWFSNVQIYEAHHRAHSYAKTFRGRELAPWLRRPFPRGSRSRRARRPDTSRRP